MPKNKALTKALFAPGEKKAKPITGLADNECAPGPCLLLLDGSEPTDEEWTKFGGQVYTAKWPPTEDQFKIYLDEIQAHLARISGHRRDTPKEQPSKTTEAETPSAGRVPASAPEAASKPSKTKGTAVKSGAAGDSGRFEMASNDHEEDSDSNAHVNARFYRYGSVGVLDEKKFFVPPFVNKYLELAAEFKRIMDNCDGYETVVAMIPLLKNVNELHSTLKPSPSKGLEQNARERFFEQLRVLHAEFERVVNSADSAYGAAEKETSTTSDVIDVASKESADAVNETVLDPVKKDSEDNDVVKWKFDDVVEPGDVTVEAVAGGDNQKKVDDVIKKGSEAIDVSDEEEWVDEAAAGGFKPVCQCAVS